MKLPVILALEVVRRNDDVWTSEFVMTIPSNPVSITNATMRSDLDGDANVVEVVANGLDNLDHDVRDRFLVRLFKLAWSQMKVNDGSGIAWTISDISRFIENQFTAVDAASVLYVLGRLAPDDLVVKDRCIVRVD